MKKFKFFKVLYYALVVVVGLILCVVLPNYNEYNLISTEMSDVVVNEEYHKLPGYFYSKYYNDEFVYNEKIKDKDDLEHNVFIFETILYDNYDTTNGLNYCKEAYMVFILGGSTFDYSTIQNEYGHDEYNAKLVVNGTDLKKDIAETFYKINDKGIDLLYFDISKTELEENGLNSIESISVVDKDSDEYINISLTTSLNYVSPFFTKAQGYISLYNSICTDFEAVLNGTFTFENNQTVMSNGSKITLNPYGYVNIYFEAEGSFIVEGAKKVEETKDDNGNTIPEHYVVSERNVLVKATSDVNLKKIKVEFGDILVEFHFDGTEEGYYFNGNVTDGEHKLGKAYDQETLVENINKWLEDYEYGVSNAGANITNGRIMWKTIIQIVIYFAVVLIIGDFLVGKHYIVYIFQKIFKKNKHQVTKEEENINNDYNVNVEIYAYVPVGYDQDVYVKYVKDEENVIEVTLRHSTGYKHVERFQNGIYKLDTIKAEGLHQMKPVRELKVRGFKFKVEIMLANDEGVTPTIKTEE